MSDVPFGFGPHRDDPDEPDRPGPGGTGASGPGGLPDFGALAGFGLPAFPGAGGPIPEDLAGKVPLFAALQQLLSSPSGPVNWDLARQMAVSAPAAGRRAPGPFERSKLAKAVGSPTCGWTRPPRCRPA